MGARGLDAYRSRFSFAAAIEATERTLDNATDCIAGYACGMEGSIREYQRHTTQWGMGKNFDQSGSVGPWMVTADELPRGAKGLKIESRLNGNMMQSSNTDQLLFGPVALVEYISQVITLMPGDLILTGTPGGVGAGRTPPRFVQPDETVAIAIEGLGELRNRFTAP